MTLTKKQINKYRIDYKEYAEKNLKIQTKAAEIIPFVFNRMQIVLWNLLLEDLKAGIPIRWLIVKDRQLGCSTWITGLFYWICTLFANKNGLTVSHDIDSAAGLFSKIKLFFKLSQPELRPQRKISNRRELYFANPDDEGPLGLESRITIDTADSAEIGVSHTIQLAHLSEMAVWEAMGLNIKQRMAALNQAIPEKPGTIVIIETTPRGEGYVSKMWDDKNNGYRKIFISSVADDEYRIELNPNEYFELIDYEEHKYGDETLEYDYYENEIKIWYSISDPALLHHEVMCRLAWRRYMIDKKCEGDKEIFDREYPITIEKAFATSGANIFPTTKLKKYKKYLLDNSVRYTAYRYDDLLKDFYLSAGGPIKVYEPPDKNYNYILGADVALGVDKDGDDSAFTIRRVPDLKLCVSYKNVIDPFEFAKILFSIIKLYNRPYTGVEVNERGGFAVVEYLLNHFHYTNLYQREVIGEIDKPKTKKYGWSSNPKTTKPSMVADYKNLIINGELDLDIDLVDQAIKYVLKDGLMQASLGKDDLLCADMITIQMARFVHVSETPKPKRYKYTLDWWVKQLEQENDVIGQYPRG